VPLSRSKNMLDGRVILYHHKSHQTCFIPPLAFIPHISSLIFNLSSRVDHLPLHTYLPPSISVVSTLPTPFFSKSLSTLEKNNHPGSRPQMSPSSPITRPLNSVFLLLGTHILKMFSHHLYPWDFPEKCGRGIFSFPGPLLSSLPVKHS